MASPDTRPGTENSRSPWELAGDVHNARNPLDAVRAVFGLGGDSEEPVNYAALARRKFNRGLSAMSVEELQDFANRLATAGGQAGSLGWDARVRHFGDLQDKVMAALGEQGVTDFSPTSSFDPNTPLTLQDTNRLMALAKQSAGIFGSGWGHKAEGIHRGVLEGMVEQHNTELANQKIEDFANKEIFPSLDKAQGIITDLADQPLFGAKYIGDAQARITAQIKGNAEEKLRYVGAALGLRGLSPDTPAGAAVAARTAQEANADMASQWTQFGLDTTQANRASATSIAQLLSGVATQRLATQAGLESHDLARLTEVGSNLGSIFEAIRTQRENDQLQRDLMRQQTDAAGQAGMMKAGGSALSALLPLLAMFI